MGRLFVVYATDSAKMSLIAAYMESFTVGQAQVDAKRREDMLYYFQAATVKKTKEVNWAPTNMPFLQHRTFPTFVIDNWSAAFKVRQHWEEQTELRKAAGKTIY